MSGITWDVDPVLFHAGTLAVHTYSLLFAATFVAGLLFLRWQLARFGVDAASTAWLVLATFAGVIIGTRVAHAAFYSPALLADPGRLARVSAGGLASHGAAVALPLVMWFFARVKKLSFGDVLDACAMPSAFGAALVRLGNLANSEILGSTTSAPWGFRFVRLHDEALRHPVQLYEAVLALAVLAVLVRAHRSRPPRWRLSGLFFSLYFGGRLALELFKDEGRLSPWLTTGQLLSLPFALLGVALLVRRPAGLRELRA